MPEMNGFELLDRISGDARFYAVPAIALTSAIRSKGNVSAFVGQRASKSELSASALPAAITDVSRGPRLAV